MKQEFESAVGMTKVFQMMSHSKKPIIGHNMMLDVAHTLAKFSNWLPATSAEFKAQVMKAFPTTFDTKHIASHMPEAVKSKLLSTALGDLFEFFNKDELFKSPTIVLSESSKRYENAACAHEAGYDAYMTGSVFLKLVHQLETSYHTTDAIVSSAKLSSAFKNKLNVHGAAVPFALEGEQPEMDFSKIFHVSGFPETTGTKDIVDFFKEFAPVEVKWLDSSSLIVILKDSTKAPHVMDALGKSKKYSVAPYRGPVQRESPSTGANPWIFAAAAGILGAAAYYYYLHRTK